jgi:hypothetical protein
LEPNQRHRVGGDTVFVIPVGPNCREDFVADTLDSIIYFAPSARIILVDDSQTGLGLQLATRFVVTNIETEVHGLFGNLYLNLSRGFEEALSEPFRILVRLDTDGLIAGSDFEAKAEVRFQSDLQLGSLGSFQIGYDRRGIRDRSWAKRQILRFLFTHTLAQPRRALTVARLLVRARRHGYRFGEAIMGGAAVYRFEAIQALHDSGLLGRAELAATRLHEDYIFGLCLPAIGYRLGEFGDGFDDLPMGVSWVGLPASPQELMRRGKSIIHSTKSFEEMDEEAIRQEFRSAREKE